MNKMPSPFQELWRSENKSLDIEKYELCFSELQKANEKQATIQWILAIVFSILGLWAVYYDSTFIAVALLLIAVSCNGKSTSHILMTGKLNTDRLLAMLINNQARDLEAIRNEIKKI